MADPILAMLDQRSTTNLFDPQVRVEDAQISELVRVATKAPTAFNLQNWRFIAVRSEEGKQRLRSLAFGQEKVEDAAVTFIVCGVLPESSDVPVRLAPMVEAGYMPSDLVAGWMRGADGLYDGQPTRQRDEAVRSATFGASALMFAARAIGLGSAPMIGFDAEGVSRGFALKANEIPVMLVAIGGAMAENWPQKPRRAIDEVLDFV
ncbi:nitroreductase family protein [Novosphingobium profundi]|nr:nitroreductase family protein [Novosphingobium profundi]